MFTCSRLSDWDIVFIVCYFRIWIQVPKKIMEEHMRPSLKQIQQWSEFRRNSFLMDTENAGGSYSGNHVFAWRNDGKKILYVFLTIFLP